MNRARCFICFNSRSYSIIVSHCVFSYNYKYCQTAKPRSERQATSIFQDGKSFLDVYLKLTRMSLQLLGCHGLVDRVLQNILQCLKLLLHDMMSSHSLFRNLRRTHTAHNYKIAILECAQLQLLRLLFDNQGVRNLNGLSNPNCTHLGCFVPGSPRYFFLASLNVIHPLQILYLWHIFCTKAFFPTVWQCEITLHTKWDLSMCFCVHFFYCNIPCANTSILHDTVWGHQGNISSRTPA